MRLPHPQDVSLQDLLTKLGRPFKEYELWALSHACLSTLRTLGQHPGDPPMGPRPATHPSVSGPEPGGRVASLAHVLCAQPGAGGRVHPVRRGQPGVSALVSGPRGSERSLKRGP